MSWLCVTVGPTFLRSNLLRIPTRCLNTPMERYTALLNTGKLVPDQQQLHAAHQVEETYTGLMKMHSMLERGVRHQEEISKGLYLHGNVGSGKTLLMDLLYDSIPTSRKKRVHFHSFMLYVYSEINKWNLAHPDADYPGTEYISPTEFVAHRILSDAWLLFFDEIQLADYGSCALLKGVLDTLVSNGAVIIGTSNRSPEDLGDSSISENFDGTVDDIAQTMISFKKILVENCEVYHLDSERDHREELTRGEERYLYPVTLSNKKMLDVMFSQQCTQADIQSSSVHVYGREVLIPACCGTTARFTFDELCRAPLGPADYIVICNQFTTIFVDDIPQLSIRNKNEARRLLSFIDAAYETRAQLFCTAAAPPTDIFSLLPPDRDTNSDFHNDGGYEEQMHFEMIGQIAHDLKMHGLDFSQMGFISGEDEIFSFQRAISRLSEMQSAAYQRSIHRKQAFLPYVGTSDERERAMEGRRIREAARLERLKELEQSRKQAHDAADKSLEHDANNTDEVILTSSKFEQQSSDDWADEASYRSWSSEVEAAERKHFSIEEREKWKKPTFNESHFWGFGWWENITDKFKRKKDK